MEVTSDLSKFKSGFWLLWNWIFCFNKSGRTGKKYFLLSDYIIYQVYIYSASTTIYSIHLRDFLKHEFKKKLIHASIFFRTLFSLNSFFFSVKRAICNKSNYNENSYAN